MRGDVPVAGLRVLGHNRVFLFHKLLRGGRCIQIGRTRQRHVRLRDNTVSRRHARIRRTDDGQFQIEEWDSTNGIFIAPHGWYSEYQEVESATLHFGMLIRLGNVTLVPVDARGNCPMLIARHSEFIRVATAVYGSAFAAARWIGGMSRQSIARLLQRLRGRKRA